MTQGSLWAALHQLARRLATVPQRLLLEYRRAPVKHADETGWRTDGHNGYAWLFCTATGQPLSFSPEPLGQRRPRGVRDPSAAGGLGRGSLQWLQSRCPVRSNIATRTLLREVQDLGKEFPDVGEVSRLSSQFRSAAG